MEEQPKEQPPRNACVSCRAKKIRCLPSDVPGTCQKCQRLQQECKLPGVILRPRRKKLVNRIEQLERSLGNVTAELAEQRASESSSVPDVQNPTTAATSSNLDFNAASNLPSGLSSSHYEDVIQKGILTPEYAEILLSEFKIMAENFPYIVIPPNSTIADYRTERPMLFLSMLCSASWQDRSLQITLEQYYLNELSVRMVVKGEQSLDILQGLLVHLAWCHFHMKPAFRLVAFAVSNVISLGLDCKARSNGSRVSRLNFEFLRKPDLQFQPSSGFWGAEAKRAYIGCYVVSTSYALCLRKTGALRYSKYLEECALSLAAENQIFSDISLVHYIRLMHHAEEVSETFGYNEGEQILHFTDDRLQFYIKYFDAQLQTLKSSIPLGLSSDIMLQASHTLVSAYTHEIGLYNMSGANLSPARMTILHDCLLSIHHILEMIKTTDDRRVRTLMGYSWVRVYYSINLAMELTLGIVSPSWNIESVRSIIKLEEYLDLFCARLMDQSSRVQSSDGKSNWFQVLADNLTGIRSKYTNGLRLKGILVPDRQSQLLHEGTGIVVPQNTGVENVPYGYADISTMDFMLNDWSWLPPDPSLYANQAI